MNPVRSCGTNLKGGFDFVRNNHTTLNVVMLVGVLGMFGLAYNVLVPTFVRYDLLPNATSAQQVQAFGFLESVRGAGALLAALLIAVLSRPSRYKWNIIIGGLLSNAVVMIYAFRAPHRCGVSDYGSLDIWIRIDLCQRKHGYAVDSAGSPARASYVDLHTGFLSDQGRLVAF